MSLAASKINCSVVSQ